MIVRFVFLRNKVTSGKFLSYHMFGMCKKCKDKVIPLQARCGPEGG